MRRNKILALKTQRWLMYIEIHKTEILSSYWKMIKETYVEFPLQTPSLWLFSKYPLELTQFFLNQMSLPPYIFHPPIQGMNILIPPLLLHGARRFGHKINRRKQPKKSKLRSW
jgi:hypothetical protein